MLSPFGTSIDMTAHDALSVPLLRRGFCHDYHKALHPQKKKKQKEPKLRVDTCISDMQKT